MKKLKSILLLATLIISVSVFAQTSKTTTSLTPKPSEKTTAITQKKVNQTTKAKVKKGDALRVNARKKNIGEWLENEKTKIN